MNMKHCVLAATGFLITNDGESGAVAKLFVLAEANEWLKNKHWAK